MKGRSVKEEKEPDGLAFRSYKVKLQEDLLAPSMEKRRWKMAPVMCEKNFESVKENT